MSTARAATAEVCNLHPNPVRIRRILAHVAVRRKMPDSTFPRERALLIMRELVISLKDGGYHLTAQGEEVLIQLQARSI